MVVRSKGVAGEEKGRSNGPIETISRLYRDRTSGGRSAILADPVRTMRLLLLVSFFLSLCFTPGSRRSFTPSCPRVFFASGSLLASREVRKDANNRSLEGQTEV